MTLLDTDTREATVDHVQMAGRFTPADPGYALIKLVDVPADWDDADLISGALAWLVDIIRDDHPHTTMEYNVDGYGFPHPGVGIVAFEITPTEVS